MSRHPSIHNALQAFAAAVTAKMTQLTMGEPEDQLRGPFEGLMAGAAGVVGAHVVCTGETPLPGRLGRPDYAVHVNGLLAGYVELKSPGTGATATRFRGHNRDQFRRFSAVPNLLYTDGNEWALYRGGELEGRVVRLAGDVAADGAKAAAGEDARALERLLRDFLVWQPIIPTDGRGKIDLTRFADMLAPLCRLLRDDVTDALQDADSPLVQLAQDWRQLLFPNATDAQFADAYAQTVTFALLLARGEGAEPLRVDSAVAALAAEHNLLSRALQVLSDPLVGAEIAAPLNLLLRVIAAVPPATLSGPEDPWLYFYEDFLAVYDPELRKNAGAYYTPVEVVGAQVRLIDDLLVHRLGKPLGFADRDVVTLDPAVGTGTYLLGAITHALGRIKADYGPGAVAGYANDLADNLHGFELMVGPYAVSELRVSRALRDRGGRLPIHGTHVYLTDTLESPHAEPPQLPLFLRPIAEQHARALEVKSNVPVIVCLGNPPYDRHEAATEENQARTGGWVRWGDDGTGENAILRDFLNPAIAAGHGVHVKNLYNLYVYFWRWALWKVFEQENVGGPGVISFISASSYLDGDAFCGMREHMRRVCDEIWILDLGGEGRGTRQSENVFDIQTPVAIAVAVRTTKDEGSTPARVRYARIEGTRAAKLVALEAIEGFSSVTWQDCSDVWQDPFRPEGEGEYFDWPLFSDLLPWSGRGIQFSRTWPVAENTEILSKRWQNLIAASGDRQKELLKETRDVKSNKNYQSFINNAKLERVDSLSTGDEPEAVVRFTYRSYDRQWCIADRRVIDMPRPSLWTCLSNQQIYLITIADQALSSGQAVSVSTSVPDLNAFRGSCGGLVYPIYRTADASEANILPGLLDLLGEAYRREVTPEDLLAYIYGALAQPAFTERFHDELETRELRVPITRDAGLFEQVRYVGAWLLWLHTYGERFVAEDRPRGRVPRGEARCTKAAPGDAEGYPESFAYEAATRTLHVGEGAFAPVAPEIYEFEVSGLKVVQSWLKYRMKRGAGRTSSPLDDIRPTHWTSQFTTELLELLWVLEATVAGYGEQAALLEAVVNGECFMAEELPEAPEWMRVPPKVGTQGRGLFD